MIGFTCFVPRRRAESSMLVIRITGHCEGIGSVAVGRCSSDTLCKVRGFQLTDHVSARVDVALNIGIGVRDGTSGVVSVPPNRRRTSESAATVRDAMSATVVRVTHPGRSPTSSI